MLMFLLMLSKCFSLAVNESLKNAGIDAGGATQPPALAYSGEPLSILGILNPTR
jgi:hypothetical protein